MTYALVALNVLVYVGAILSDGRSEDGSDVYQLALHPESMRWWALVTYQFLHAGIWHLAGNMLFLWCFGPNVEDRFGRFWFVLFYLLGGCAAGLVHSAVSAHPVVGASGSIAAVTGAYLVLFPRTHVKVFFFLLFIGVFQLPAAWFLGASIAWDILFNSGAGSGVAVAAHLGGYGFGGGVSFALLGLKLIPRESYDLFSLAKQAHRRRVFKDQVAQGRSAWSHQHQLHAAGERPADARGAAERAALFQAISAGDGGAMDRAYRALLEVEPSGSLPRDSLLELANRLYGAGSQELAASAYESFLRQYPKDGESSMVRLMLGMLCARRLNDPIRAKALLHEAQSGRLTEGQRELAAQLLEELG